MIEKKASTIMLISDYQAVAVSTSKISENRLDVLRIGLFGEVGSLMATYKKLKREPGVISPDRRHEKIEELGDIFWYLINIVDACDLKFHSLISELELLLDKEVYLLAGYKPTAPLLRAYGLDVNGDKFETLKVIGEKCSKILTETPSTSLLTDFLFSLLQLMASEGISLNEVLVMNEKKISSRYSNSSIKDLPTFDQAFSDDERIPEVFEIVIKERGDGRTYMRMNNVVIGDPLSDNNKEDDGYRFHDVFHFSYAAILHWSPTFRSLIKHKRKSKKEIDEAEDGGRAGVIDEGVAAFVFSHAKLVNFFEGHDSVSTDLLKSIHRFVSGYEVAECPLWLWERAILDGFAVFRQLRSARQGCIIGNRKNRTIEYRALGGE
ncbi:MAG: pyrophosphatase [Alphaproteobacteria bacterium]|nr:pyrophosphatase [Alphaproteobacteria bacterium]